MKIELLSEQLASQIAAGEVVERPASVVKELVENALDAGADIINIEIRDGGKELIQVADNGSGIDAAQIELAFLRHATSKIQKVDDLNGIKTLGFRGEALAAISAVSKMTVVSRAADADAGTRLVLSGGHLMSREQTGAPVGTIMGVEQLFFNTPARLKFMKSKTTQKRHIDEFITRYAMAYPHVRFRLSHDGKVTFQTNGNGSLLDVLLAVYGVDTARGLLEIKAVGGIVDNGAPIVHGYVGPPSYHRSNRNQISLFVNGRWIQDQKLTYAVIQAYHTLLPTGRYPMAAVFLTISPAEVDVNVHPAKTEVRFQDGNRLFGVVQRAVRETLVSDSPIRSVSHFQSFTPFPKSKNPGWAGSVDDSLQEMSWSMPQERTGSGAEEGQMRMPINRPTFGNEGGEERSMAPLRTPTLDEPGKLPMMRVVGQVGAAFIITEGPDGLYLLDQHAAHERILYEQFMAAWGQDELGSQRLVTGQSVSLAPEQATLLEAHLELFSQIGFEIEGFGPNTYMIRAVPQLLAKQNPANAIMEIVEELERGDKPMQAVIEAKIVMRVCKSASVKAGQTLSMNEMEAMVQQLEACESPHTCPHGRPTLIYLSVAQLAREFGRI